MRSPIPIEKFGEDHWNMLIHVETRCVEYDGFLERVHLRTDGKEHPTVLKGGEEVPDHSDLHCIQDLVTAGLLEDRGHLQLTDLGWRVFCELRRHLAAGGASKEFEPTRALPLLDEEKRALQWVIAGDTGISSMAIWAVMMGQVENDIQKTKDIVFYDPPEDCADFGRCFRLLQHIPEWRKRLQEVGEAIPRWQPFVREWRQLEALCLDPGKEHDLARLLENLLQEGRTIGDVPEESAGTYMAM